MSRNRFTTSVLLVSGSLAGLTAATSAQGQTAPASAAADNTQASDSSAPDAQGQEQEIVVQGFRASLDNALNLKREETAAVDSIVAEDIGKFPDSNLAESMQRIPGVALSRGDGGEGRNISVRGLGPQFTRVRINGMEGISQVSGSDIRGGVAGGRSFDFVTFPTEIFSSLAVRKTTSADVEEGSLGATVDLRAPKPFDQSKDFAFSATARGIYNDISKKADPRLSALVSKKFGGTFGVLGSIAYSKRNIVEYAYSAVDILPSYVAGQAQTVPTAPGATTTQSVLFPYCTPVGYVFRGVPVNSPAPGYANSGTSVGADANNCSTGNPRTSTVTAYDYIMSRTGVSGRPGGGVFLPRLPRPVKSRQDQERIAGTLTLQWKPSDATDISIDGLYARFKVDRLDTMLDARSMGRTASNNGQPMMSVRDIEVDDNGSLIYGLWDGVDLRSEMQDEHFTSTFRQANFNLDHRFSDSFRVFGLAGISESKLEVNRLQVAMDANDTDNFSIDFRDGDPNMPKLGYGVDPSDAAIFQYGPPLPNGDQRGQISNFDRTNTILNKTFELNAEWEATPGFKVQAGGQYRTGDYTQRQFDLIPSQRLPLTLPAGVSLRDISFVTTGVADNLGGNMQDFAAIDPDKFRRAVNYDSIYQFCGIECASYYATVEEKYTSGYLMVKFDTKDMMPLSIRGDAGVRYVRTEFHTEGTIPTAAPAGSVFPTIGVISTVERSYEDWLPSINVAVDLTPNLIGRLSAARVMSRAQYGQLTPSGNVNVAIRTGSFSNPQLEPIRANTFDAALEWYFAPGSLLSVAYFYKDIETYIQTTPPVLVPFRDLGLPESLLTGAGSGVTIDEQFSITRVNNTPGGPLRGFEVNLQLPFRFLPGFLSNFGALANFTRVRSNIDYIVAGGGTRTAPLVGLSPETASGTLYYEDDRFSIRSTINYRAAYLTGIPGPQDSDANGAGETIFVDASASYNLSENVKLIAEVSNITNEQNNLFTDTVRQDPLYTSNFGRTFAVAVNFQF